MILTAVGAVLSLATTLVLASPASPVNQERISVKVEGTGADLILIPGLASSAEVWADLASTLRQHHRLHLVQIAGFAGLPAVAGPGGKVVAPIADGIADYIRRQGIEAPAIIGHSLGGEVALMLGARYPDLVGRLMVVDALPFYSLLFGSAVTSKTAAPHAAQARDAMLRASTEQNETMHKATIARLVKTEALRPSVLIAATRSDRRTVADATYELMVTDLRPELGRIKVPVDVVYAYDDLYGVPASDVDAMFRDAYVSTPEVNFKRIDGSFHFVMLDQAERFTSVVVEFLDR